MAVAGRDQASQRVEHRFFMAVVIQYQGNRIAQHFFAFYVVQPPFVADLLFTDMDF